MPLFYLAIMDALILCNKCIHRKWGCSSLLKNWPSVLFHCLARNSMHRKEPHRKHHTMNMCGEVAL